MAQRVHPGTTFGGGVMSALGPERSAGVLLHVSSLPSRFGIGDFGPEAYKFVDLLADAGFRWWQILPLNPPDGSNSPYSASSAFAGNELLISAELLAEEGLIDRSDWVDARSTEGDVRFSQVRREKLPVLNRAAEALCGRASKRLRHAFESFREVQRLWLDDFALFAALAKKHPGRSWRAWPRALARRDAAALRETRRELRDEIERVQALQFLFFRQLDALRAHAHKRGVKLMGDVPIYVSYESADVWANPHLFELDRAFAPRAVAGVPPDLFSRTGQRWGNPIYDWKAMRRDGFRWWGARLRAALAQSDVVRIDHFRGLAGYWRIPASAKTAVGGCWVRGPGAELLDAVARQLGGLPLVAEDLGHITPDVTELRDRFGLPGMQILQLAIGDPTGNNLPHQYGQNLIVYTGNHDNDTTLGWLRSLDRKARRQLETYAPEAKRDPLHAMWRLAWASVARLAINPCRTCFASAVRRG